jgi:hypothetical protein
MKTAGALMLVSAALLSAAPPADRTAWWWQAPIAVGQAGMVRLELPPPVLDVTRSDLGDIRLISPSGVETPYFIEQPVMFQKDTLRNVGDFKLALSGRSTVIEMATGTTAKIEVVALDSPAREFLKSVTIEGRQGADQWQPVAVNEVIFRQAGGAERLMIPIPAGAWDTLRCTVDDERAEPVPFTGARVRVAGDKPASVELPVALGTREELADETRLTLDFGARNLNIAEILLEIEDPVFHRSCHLGAPTAAADGGTRLRSLGPFSNATIYRVLGEHGLSTAALAIPVHQRLGLRSVVAVFTNGDNPPLTITGAKIRCYPTVLAFHAATAGHWQLFTGNQRAKTPDYDLNPMRAALATAGGQLLLPGPLSANLDYQVPAPLPGVDPAGAAISLADWARRRPVKAASPGVIRIELDALALAGCQLDLGDVRLVQNGRQIPYLLMPGTVTRDLKSTAVMLAQDPKRPTVSCWEITLPVAGVPVAGLTAESPTRMFARKFAAICERTDELGNRRTEHAGTAEWTKSGGGPTPLSLILGGQRMPRTFTLETDHGDNPPIEVEDVRVQFEAPSIAAKLTDGAPLFLYYGNAKASPPQYDLRLVRNAMQAADQQPAVLGDEEVLKPATKPDRDIDTGAPWLWLALGAVVIALLAIVAKLLPRPAET